MTRWACTFETYSKPRFDGQNEIAAATVDQSCQRSRYKSPAVSGYLGDTALRGWLVNWIRSLGIGTSLVRVSFSCTDNRNVMVFSLSAGAQISTTSQRPAEAIPIVVPALEVPGRPVTMPLRLSSRAQAGRSSTSLLPIQSTLDAAISVVADHPPALAGRSNAQRHIRPTYTAKWLGISL